MTIWTLIFCFKSYSQVFELEIYSEKQLCFATELYAEVGNVFIKSDHIILNTKQIFVGELSTGLKQVNADSLFFLIDKIHTADTARIYHYNNELNKKFYKSYVSYNKGKILNIFIGNLDIKKIKNGQLKETFNEYKKMKSYALEYIFNNDGKVKSLIIGEHEIYPRYNPH